MLRLLLLAPLWLLTCSVLPLSAQTDSHGLQVSKWAPLELTFTLPAKSDMAIGHPFDIQLDVVFIAPDGSEASVPAYYDGKAGGELIWRCRFSADQQGVWTYRTLAAGTALDQRTGSFRVGPVAADASGFYRWGRLEYTGTPANDLRYMKFRDGPFWLKAGCDNPENFLGSSKNFDTAAKRRAAIDFLSSRGINSLYIMTHNLGGDFKDVWPWKGRSANQAKLNAGKKARFNLDRLRVWQDLFEYMQEKAVVPYIILEDDSAWDGYDHQRYYREMIARFGYLPAVVFNLGEEFQENHSLKKGIAMAKEFRRLDPYRHPLGIHDINNPDPEYLENEVFDFAAIQTWSKDSLIHNEIAAEWIEASKKRGVRTPMIGFDEPRPVLDRRGWWAAYLGGAVWQVHAKQPFDDPHPSREPVWTQLGGTRAFMESLPFWQMIPDQALIQSGRAFALRKSDQILALYLPVGGNVQLDLPADNRYRMKWWSPDNGRLGRFIEGQVLSGPDFIVSAPDSGDWAVVLEKL